MRGRAAKNDIFVRLKVVLAAVFLCSQFLSAAQAHEEHDDHGPVDADPCVICLIKSSKDSEELDDAPVFVVALVFAKANGTSTPLKPGLGNLPNAFPRGDPPPVRGPPLS